MPRSTTNIDARRWRCASGSVTAKTSRKSAALAFEANHLWPLMTQSSPSRRAAVVIEVGSLLAMCGSVSAKQLVTWPSSSGSSQRLRCSGFAPTASSSLLPESGAWLPKIAGADVRAAEDLVHQGEPELAEAAAAEVGIEMGGPQPARLDGVLQRLGHRFPLLFAHAQAHEVEQLDLGDHLADPLELALGFGVSAEVPCHGGTILTRVNYSAAGVARLSRDNASTTFVHSGGQSLRPAALATANRPRSWTGLPPSGGCRREPWAQRCGRVRPVTIGLCPVGGASQPGRRSTGWSRSE